MLRKERGWVWWWTHWNLEKLHEGGDVCHIIMDMVSGEEIVWISPTRGPLPGLVRLRGAVVGHITNSLLAAWAAHATQRLMALKSLSSGPSPRSLPWRVMTIWVDCLIRTCYRIIIISHMRRLHRCIRLSIFIGGLYRAHRFCEQLVVVGAESMLCRLHWNLCLLLLKSRKSSIGLSCRALYDCRLCYLILILRIRDELQLLMRFDVTHDLFQILVLVHSISYALSRVMVPHEASECRLRHIWCLCLRAIIGALSRLLGWSFLLARCAIGA